MRSLGGASIDYTAKVSESVLARLHFVVRMPVGEPMGEVDVRALERELTAGDPVLERRVRRPGRRPSTIPRTSPRWSARCPRATRRTTPPSRASWTSAALTALDRRPRHVDGHVRARPGGRRGRPAAEDLPPRRVDVAVQGAAAPVAARCRRHRRTPVRARARWRPPRLHLRLRPDRARWRRGGPQTLGSRRSRQQFMDAFAASFAGRSESDGFNALVMRADLGWRDVSVLRAIGRYLRQVGITYSQTYIAQALSANVDLVRLLVELFRTRFDPDLGVDDDRPGPPTADGAAHQDHRRPGRRGQPRPRPDHPALPLGDRRDHPDQRVRRRSPDPGVQAAAPANCPSCPSRGRAFEIFVYSPRLGGRASALRLGRPRRSALVRPRRGLPDRDPRPGQGADGEERGDRAGRRQGRVLRQAAARPERRPRRLAGRGRGLLQAVHHQPARRHRQHRRRPGRPAARRRPLRRRRPLPGRRRRQGHRDLLRHRQRDLGRVRLLARRRVRLRRLGRLRPQGDGHHRPRRLGLGAAALP